MVRKAASRYVQSRGAAALLAALGIFAWILGSTWVELGENNDRMGDTGVLLLVIACVRTAYISLLEQDEKFAEGHSRGFRLGRRTSRPVVVPMPQHETITQSEPNEAR